MISNPGKAQHGLSRRTGAVLIAFTMATSGLLAIAAPASAVPALTVPMGTLTSFSALAHTTITDTGSTSTFVDGVGVSPGIAITTISDDQVQSGGIHRNDAIAQQAQADLVIAYQYAEGQAGAAIAAQLGGETLHPGVHTAGATALGLTGTLILDGDGSKNSVFIIQTAGAFTAAANAQVVLTDGAQECNVFFQVEGAVTLGATADFRGNILGKGAITVGAGALFHGRAMTTLGDMTLSDNDFFEPTCARDAEVTVGAVSGSTSEAATTSTFTVVLASQPTATVTIAVTSSDTTEGTVSPGLLTFTTTDWNTAQTVTVTGVDDPADDGDITYTIALAPAAGGDYTGIDPTDVSVTNTDNDTTPGGGVSGDVAPAATGLVDTSTTCPNSLASSGFGDLAGFDDTTTHAIDCIFAYGVSNGTTGVTFTPSGTVPRWQMALFLIRQLRAHGVFVPTAMDQGFNDIGDFDQETRDAINQLSQLGITHGTSIGTFSPSNSISRWEMALFLVRSVALLGAPMPTTAPPSAGFTDIVLLDTETTTAIDQLVALGIAEGTSPSTYDPQSSVLRWQMALFLTRVLAVDGILPT